MRRILMVVCIAVVAISSWVCASDTLDRGTVGIQLIVETYAEFVDLPDEISLTLTEPDEYFTATYTDSFLVRTNGPVLLLLENRFPDLTDGDNTLVEFDGVWRNQDDELDWQVRIADMEKRFIGTEQNERQCAHLDKTSELMLYLQALWRRENKQGQVIWENLRAGAYAGEVTLTISKP